MSALLIHRCRALENLVRTGFASWSILFVLADQGFLQTFRKFSDGLKRLAEHADPLLRELASLRLAAITEEVEDLGRGTVVFAGTETWRTAYQKLLVTLKVKSYFSVAWVRTDEYWNDLPGRQSVQLNYDLVEHGFHIQRIHILPNHLWTDDERLPAPSVRPWLSEQHQRGIVVYLVRESALANEADLARDIGIYGDRATAVLELDDQGRSTRFVLSFDRATIRKALDRWERLSLYAIPWEQIADEIAGRF